MIVVSVTGLHLSTGHRLLESTFYYKAHTQQGKDPVKLGKMGNNMAAIVSFLNRCNSCLFLLRGRGRRKINPPFTLQQQLSSPNTNASMPTPCTKPHCSWNKDQKIHPSLQDLPTLADSSKLISHPSHCTHTASSATWTPYS